MKFKKSIFFLMCVTALCCGGCKQQPQKEAKEPMQTVEETKETGETPADIYEVQTEEE